MQSNMFILNFNSNYYFFTRAIENATSIEGGIVLNMQCEYITWLEH